MTRHVVFTRRQIEMLAEQFEEFAELAGVDFQYDSEGDPIRIEYIWRD